MLISVNSDTVIFFVILKSLVQELAPADICQGRSDQEIRMDEPEFTLVDAERLCIARAESAGCKTRIIFNIGPIPLDVEEAGNLGELTRKFVNERWPGALYDPDQSNTRTGKLVLLLPEKVSEYYTKKRRDRRGCCSNPSSRKGSLSLKLRKPQIEFVLDQDVRRRSLLQIREQNSQLFGRHSGAFGWRWNVVKALLKRGFGGLLFFFEWRHYSGWQQWKRF